MICPDVYKQCCVWLCREQQALLLCPTGTRQELSPLQTGENTSHSHSSETQPGKAMDAFSWHGRWSHTSVYQTQNISPEGQTNEEFNRRNLPQRIPITPKANLSPHFPFFSKSTQNIDLDSLPSTCLTSGVWKPREDNFSLLALTGGSSPLPSQKSPKDLLSHC